MVRVMVVGLVAVIAFLAGPISAAYAGGMGRGSGGAYVCYIGFGASPGGGMDDLTDEFLSRDVKIGGLRLVCAPVFGGTRSAGDLKNPDPPDPCVSTDPAEVCADHFKCYDLRSSKGDNAATTLTLSDFFRAEDTVGVGGAQVLCVGAQIVQPPTP